MHAVCDERQTKSYPKSNIDPRIAADRDLREMSNDGAQCTTSLYRGDIHGQYEQLIGLLRGVGLVD